MEIIKNIPYFPFDLIFIMHILYQNVICLWNSSPYKMVDFM